MPELDWKSTKFSSNECSNNSFPQIADEAENETEMKMKMKRKILSPQAPRTHTFPGKLTCQHKSQRLQS